MSPAPAPDDAPARELAELRRRIEEIDREIVTAVADRLDVARRIGALKRDAHGATLVPEREAAVIRRAVESAREHGIPAEPARDLFWTLIGLCREGQLGE